jgi:uracil-DNA glycosylase
MTNVVKCRPPDNREPKKDEYDECLPLLMAQLRLLDPWVVVALGKTACAALLKTNMAISSLRGRMFRLGMSYDNPMAPQRVTEADGDAEKSAKSKRRKKVDPLLEKERLIRWCFPLYATYHPMFIGRNPAERGTWENDLTEVLAVVNKMKEAML